MNGDKVFVRAGLFDRTGLCCVSFDGSEFNPINISSDNEIPFFDPSFSLMNDTPNNWSGDAKLKLKFGVVSVTVEQHT